MGFDDISNPGLRLGLGLGLQDDEHCSSRLKKKEDDDHRPCSSNKAYPSLTLGPPDDEEANNQVPTKTESVEYCFHPRASSPSAAVSSFSNSSSIKREREDQELELEEDKIPLFPSSTVVDVDEIGNARKKLRLTKEQSAVLEDSFKEHSTLNPKQKQELARKLNLRARQVEVWFQNRRARTKLKQTEVDCEVLKKCCETLTEENKRLQKELQELKSIMKTAPPGPLYVQLPVASLTICPSCEKIGGGSSNNNNGPSPKTALLIGSKVQYPQYFYKTNYPFTHSSAAC